MQRRDFLRAGAMAYAGLSVVRSTSAETPGSDPSQFPVVISTWDFGLTPNREAYDRLREGDSPLDAVQHGVMRVEADPEVTSVGIGGYPNRDGVVELDAALMDGRTLAAGGVAGLREIKHPVAVARKVMEHTPHVLLVGDGARRFALEQGFEAEELLTDKARQAWEKYRAKQEQPAGDNHDTIGLVALRPDGRMAAACTTSGLAWKLPGRVGDSPLVGHGLYCDDQAGGAAATGVGEDVIRVCGSYQVVEFMRQGLHPNVAVRRVLQRMLRREGADPTHSVGFVALRADGEVGFASTRPGFQVTLSRRGRHEVLDAPNLLGLSKQAEPG
jgi:isoaspartyl peptidase/L-asparaginase-like protein (Ntn-hydrolase superfamily)